MVHIYDFQLVHHRKYFIVLNEGTLSANLKFANDLIKRKIFQLELEFIIYVIYVCTYISTLLSTHIEHTQTHICICTAQITIHAYSRQ